MNYYEKLGIQPSVEAKIKECESKLAGRFAEQTAITEYNQMKVLQAFQEERISDTHFQWYTGYGYDDPGREAVERVYAKVFNTEDSIVRPLIVNGTHALTLSLTGVLRPGDHMVSITGTPYDTLGEVIGTRPSKGMTLKDIGVSYEQIELLESGDFDRNAIEVIAKNAPTMVYIQRSAGYAWRHGLSIDAIESIIRMVKEHSPKTVVMVDNCYGEFLETKEPTDVGADIMAGSLIKNPGGGLALSGGYIVGKADLIERVAFRMTSPGIGKECGLTFGQTRSILQGFFMAPTVVEAALKSAILCASVFESLGFDVNPGSMDIRSDIIQAIKFGDDQKVIKFCQGIQMAAPIDSFVSPEPWPMPGYDSDVIMAAGAFVQGSSIELSADAPMREPFIAYFQGGLTYPHGKFGVMRALQNLVTNGLVKV